jgi:energy-coupling factor transport system ATP-binding protein
MNIIVSDLHFTYPAGVAALRGVSLSVAAGETVAVLGENGAGKTTLVKHFNGLLRPAGGQVTVGDWRTHEHTVAQLAARVGYVFQNPDEQLFERTVRAEVAFGPRNLGRLHAEVQAAVSEALQMVGLTGHAGEHPYDLNRSQRKLLAIAAILAMRTPIVVLDEPTTGQDARGLAHIGEIVGWLKAAGRTVIAISHDVEFCAEHFDRAIVMAAGLIVADGPAGDVFYRADALHSAAVEPPQLARLAAALGLPGTPLRVEQFVDRLPDSRLRPRHRNG